MAVENKNEIVKTGRRKCSIAVAKVVSGKGRIFVNGKTLKGYFGNRPSLEMLIFKPLVLTDNQDKLDIRVKAVGGGVSAQADAITRQIALACPMCRYPLGSGGNLVTTWGHLPAAISALMISWIKLVLPLPAAAFSAAGFFSFSFIFLSCFVKKVICLFYFYFSTLGPIRTLILSGTTERMVRPSFCAQHLTGMLL